jgi:hypothetical protein
MLHKISGSYSFKSLFLTPKKNLQTDNQEVVQRFRIYSDTETDAFLKENKNKNTGQKTKSDMKIVMDFFRSFGEFKDPNH